MKQHSNKNWPTIGKSKFVPKEKVEYAKGLEGLQQRIKRIPKVVFILIAVAVCVATIFIGRAGAVYLGVTIVTVFFGSIYGLDLAIWIKKSKNHKEMTKRCTTTGVIVLLMILFGVYVRFYFVHSEIGQAMQKGIWGRNESDPVIIQNKGLTDIDSYNSTDEIFKTLVPITTTKVEGK